ncbi:hypothetical protein [uncultured Cohaesibacter sp.]|uniref:hypothetical protein n=1 Tax=uncultured Cohaesibacter sp. TaxID=1002546 RepID=UPI0029C7ADFE|nr:hypothetical protein [uncultured Cohaesibacter sp.]
MLEHQSLRISKTPIEKVLKMLKSISEDRAKIKARQYIHACDRLGFHYFLTRDNIPAFREYDGQDLNALAELKRSSHPGPELMVVALKALKRTDHYVSRGKHARKLVFSSSLFFGTSAAGAAA